MRKENTDWLDIVRDALDAPEPSQGHTSPDEKIWDAIESRLDAQTRRRILWRRTSMGIAAATILSLITLITATRHTDNTEPGIAENVSEEFHAHSSRSSPTLPAERTMTPPTRTEAKAAGKPVKTACEHREEKAGNAPPRTTGAEKQADHSKNTGAERPADHSEGPGAARPTEQDGNPKRADSRLFREALLRTRGKQSRRIAFKAAIGGTGTVTSGTSTFCGDNIASSSGGIFNDGSTPQSVTYDHDMPLSAELSAGVAISRRFYVGTGVNYTRLDSRITKIGDDKTEVVHQRVDLIGIPLEMSYTVISGNRLSLYAGTGIMAQRCLSARHDRTAVPAPGLLWSVYGSMGIQYAFNRTVGIYAEPHISHHFTRNDLHTIYTDRRINFGLEFGLRFTFTAM